MNSILNTDSTPTSAIPLKITRPPFRNSGHAPSIAKPSKALKSLSGLNLEKEISIEFHQNGIPLLISPKLLRERNLGQIDLARIVKENNQWKIEVGEVKSSSVGEEMMLRGQRMRLHSAQNFLSGLFGFPSILIRLIFKK